MKNIKKIFDSLEGAWQLDRVISNYGVADGLAMFNRSSVNYLAYREDVKLKQNESSLVYDAFREYTYFYDESQDKIQQSFKDGSLFCELKFTDNNNSTAAGEHQCSLDLYSAHYNFYDENNFTLSYKVKGPEKDYLITTRYVKITL
jgi:hypothetical protein